MSDLKVGDVVKLKSHGPHMTIVEIGDYGPVEGKDSARCVWFDNSNNKESIFVLEALQKVE